MNPSSPTAAFVDLYQLIGVAPTASNQEIEQAVRVRRRKVRRQTGSPVLEKRQQAEQLMHQLAEAQRILLDAAARAAYDRSHAEHRAAPSATEPATASDAASLVAAIRAALDKADYRTACTLTVRATNTLDSAEAWSLHAEVLDAINQYRQAAEAAGKAVDRDPGNPQYSYQLGLEREAAGQHSLALDAYRAVDQLAPDSPLGRTGVARLMLQAGKAKEALRVLEPLHNQFPDHTLVAELYGMALAAVAEEVPRERYADGGIYITSAVEVSKMDELLRRAVSLPIEDPELRRELNSMLSQVEETATKKFTFWLFPSLRATLVTWLMAIFAITAGFSAAAAGDFVWFLIGALYCLFVYWRAYAPQWRHNKRRESARIEDRVKQRRVQEIMQELGRL
jgi:tetratricopeptide (TPR) repeat protein